MTEEGDSQNCTEATNASNAPSPSKASGTDSPKNKHYAKTAINRSKKLIKIIFARPFLFIVGWLDEHNGAITAIATAFIAGLTWAIVHVSNDTLKEMKATQADGDATSDSQFKLLRDQIRVAADQAQALKDSAAAQKIAAETAQKALIASQRAWIGPTDAGFKDPPKTNEANKLQIPFFNSGKEPATNFMPIPYTPVPAASADDPGVAQTLNENRDACLRSVPPAGGQTIYPNVVLGLGSANNQTYSFDVAGNFIAVAAPPRNPAILFFTGCYVYRTQGAAHHSAWCYFWNGDPANYQHFNLCMNMGSGAD